MWQYKAKVVRVVDGDTLDLFCDAGFRWGFTDRFRLWGIDCPERGQVGWDTSKQALERMLPAGTAVIIETHHPKERDERDSFGRWLATVYINDVNINQCMVEEGHAVEYKR